MLNFIHTAFSFLFALGLLITFHELGHYWVARLCGVKVLRFSVGMGKVLFIKRLGVDKTEWVISALPLGGYVKMLDKREQPDVELTTEQLKREFTSQSVWKRIAIVAAGPIANFILAIFLLSIVNMAGVAEPLAKLRAPTSSSQAFLSGIQANDRVIAIDGQPIQFWKELKWQLMQRALEKKIVTLTVQPTRINQQQQVSQRQIKIDLSHISAEDVNANFMTQLGLELALSSAQLGQAQLNSPAAKAGLQVGDKVLTVNDIAIRDGLDFINIVKERPNQILHLLIDRNGKNIYVDATPEAFNSGGKIIGRLQVEVRFGPELAPRYYSLSGAVLDATKQTYETSLITIKMLGKILIGQVSIKNITGPITIANYAGQTASIGLLSYLGFLAFISISLGVMNLLPIPILDGGHLLYYSLEVFLGRPIPERFWSLGQRTGLALLLTLMVVAFYNDINRLLPN